MADTNVSDEHAALVDLLFKSQAYEDAPTGIARQASHGKLMASSYALDELLAANGNRITIEANGYVITVEKPQVSDVPKQS